MSHFYVSWKRRKPSHWQKIISNVFGRYRNVTLEQNGLIDHIEFLKNELRSKDTIIKLIIENSKYNNEFFPNENNDGNQIEKFVSPKNPCKTQNIRQ